MMPDAQHWCLMHIIEPWMHSFEPYWWLMHSIEHTDACMMHIMQWAVDACTALSHGACCNGCQATTVHPRVYDSPAIAPLDKEFAAIRRLPSGARAHCKSSMVVLTTDWILMLCSVWIILVMWVAPSATYILMHSSKNGAVTVENWYACYMSSKRCVYSLHISTRQSIVKATILFLQCSACVSRRPGSATRRQAGRAKSFKKCNFHLL